MKTLQNLKSVAIVLFILGLLLFIGCSQTENPLGSEGTKTELSETFLNNLGNDATLDESLPIFVEHFEGDLSKWTGKFDGEHHAIIVKDPVRQGNHVVTFTALNFAGDIFSQEVRVKDGFTYELRFEYLGLPDLGGVPDDLGGAIGFGEGLDELGSRFLECTIPILCCGCEQIQLIDDGQWHKYSIEFDPFEPGEFYDGNPDNGTIRVRVEDYVNSGGLAGDVFFDNILLIPKGK